MVNKWRAARAILGASLLIVSASLTASAQSDDPLQAIKDSLSGQGGQDNGGLLQGVLGNGSQNGTKKTDKKLENPETVYPPTNQDYTERNIKTRDGRILRQFNEDPELRPDDSVMIEIRSIDDICQRANLGPNALQNAQNPNNPQNPPNGGVNPAAAGNPLSGALSSLGAGGTAGAASLGALGAQGGAAGLNGASPVTGINGIGGIAGYNQNANGNNNTNWFDLSRCPLPTDKPKTDDEKADEEKFEKRILAGNPYKLNRFGVIEVPGLPATPISGLTASEATKRLAADPDLNEYFVRMTLLRLTPTGDAALKPFGYDLFEGSPTTFAPVSDIQVPVDYIVGPGDSLVVQLYGNEPSTYELTVERDGRINFPKIGPIMVCRHDLRCGTRRDRTARLETADRHPRERHHRRSALDPRVRARRGAKARLLYGERLVHHDQRAVRERGRQEDRLVAQHPAEARRAADLHARPVRHAAAWR